MLELRDFFHLPQVDEWIQATLAAEPGLRLIAGPDARLGQHADYRDGFRPSGRSALFWLLMDMFLAGSPSKTCIVVTHDKQNVRIPREFRRRVQVFATAPQNSYVNQIALAMARRPQLLVVDRFAPDTAPFILQAASLGLVVLSQMDTVLWGSGVCSQLVEMGLTPDQLASLAWVVAVHRLPGLCPHCRREVLELDTAGDQPGTRFISPGCQACRGSGRQGDVAAFDILHLPRGAHGQGDLVSQVAMQDYLERLAVLGHIDQEDSRYYCADQLRRAFQLLTGREQVLAEKSAAYERKMAELEAANRVLQQRTTSLFSLEEISQALIASVDLADLAERVCRRARDVCGADRAILFFHNLQRQVEILAVGGWPAVLLHQRLQPEVLTGITKGHDPVVLQRWPPSIPQPELPRNVSLRAGLYVPLVTQDTCSGGLLVHSTQKSFFSPGEIALLKALANQAALAFQRAGMVQDLQAKIALLETAQSELAKKERLERELELARQVQQSLLPTTFPEMRGFRFAARNEPARQVGGDFYDVFVLDEQHFGIVVADVSDKGMAAALYMALTRSLLLAEARRERSPQKVVRDVNQLLLELGQPDMFVTLFYGVVDCKSRRLIYARAGHDHPFWVHDAQVHFLGGRGAALGILDSAELEMTEEWVDLAAGDRLVLYTDGLTDALNAAGELYQRERLAALVQSAGHLPAELLCEVIFASLMEFQKGAEQYDDMTLLVVEVL
jgi:serine phosphatase RsbU (regulator of sigma subunit)